MFSPEQRDLGIWAMNSTMVFDSYLCSENHNNPIMSFAGRQVNMGYGGWIDSHGLDFHQRFSETIDLLSHPEEIERFKIINYTYVIVRPDDSNLDFNFSEPKPFSHWIQIYSDPDYFLYKMVEDPDNLF